MNKTYDIEVIDDGSKVGDIIEAQQPRLLCFDFDLPDQTGLNLLQKIKSCQPTLPIIILTKDYSVELAIWALRLRAWDYFLKPINTEDMIKSVDVFLTLLSNDKKPRYNNIDLQPLVPAGPRPFRKKIMLAASFMQQQLHKKITSDDVAKYCGMSRSHFSRTFKEDYGITFQDYLVQQRMEKALVLLKEFDLQITEVAFSVGFTDLSNFSTAFQRYVGMRPLSYRHALKPYKSNNEDKKTKSIKFPSINPNPVLSSGPDGTLQFVNPATSQLIEELKLKSVEEILPNNHKDLVQTCLKTQTTLSTEHKTAGRILAWSYRPVENSDITYIYGHDVTNYIMEGFDTENPPMANPNPVLSSGPDGTLQFINPATSQLIHDLKVKSVEEILPDSHKDLVKACRKSKTTLVKEHKTAGRTFVWSYRPIENSDVTCIYGQDIDDHE